MHNVVMTDPMTPTEKVATKKAATKRTTSKNMKRAAEKT